MNHKVYVGIDLMQAGIVLSFWGIEMECLTLNDILEFLINKDLSTVFDTNDLPQINESITKAIELLKQLQEKINA